MKSQDSLIVYSGPVLEGIDEFIGIDRVGVPKFFYKAILYGDSTKAYVYLCPHEKLAKDITKYIVSIDSIESLIGIDLYKGLNENLEK
jgi:endonuclease G